MARIKGVTESETNDDVREIFEELKKRMALCQIPRKYSRLDRQSRKESKPSPKEFRNQDS